MSCRECKNGFVFTIVNHVRQIIDPNCYVCGTRCAQRSVVPILIPKVKSSYISHMISRSIRLKCICERDHCG